MVLGIIVKITFYPWLMFSGCFFFFVVRLLKVVNNLCKLEGGRRMAVGIVADSFTL